MDPSINAIFSAASISETPISMFYSWYCECVILDKHVGPHRIQTNSLQFHLTKQCAMYASIFLVLWQSVMCSFVERLVIFMVNHYTFYYW